MKNRNNKVTAVLFLFTLALAPIVQAEREPQGGPSVIRTSPLAKTHPASVVRPSPTPALLGADDGAGDNIRARAFSASSSLPVVSIHSTDNVIRGKTGTFVLSMKSSRMLGGTYVNFSVSGTAVNGVDYKLLVSPAYISQSGYGVIQIETLPDPRGGAGNQAYSVIVTLHAGAGYRLGADASTSAIMWIK